MKPKVVGRHRRGCRAVQRAKDGEWDTCWGPTAFGNYGSPVVHTTRRYGARGTKFVFWLRFVCNDPDCKAELHVEVDSIREWSEGQLKGEQ